MRKNNPKIDKIMRKKPLSPIDKLKNVLVVMSFAALFSVAVFWVLVLGDMWVTWQNNLMAPLDCLEVLNKGLRHDELGVTPKKCDFFKEKGIIKYDVDSDYWVLVNPNENNK